MPEGIAAPIYRPGQGKKRLARVVYSPVVIKSFQSHDPLFCDSKIHAVTPYPTVIIPAFYPPRMVAG